MREILFKAKKIDNGEWVEGYYYKRIQGNNVVDAIERYNGQIESIEYYEVIPETICQYTGLTDKNGNKIWENDILKKVDTNALGWVRERYCKVSFDKMGYWMITTEYGDGYWICEFESEQLEVIGNIFDNPELMKEV